MSIYLSTTDPQGRVGFWQGGLSVSALKTFQPEEATLGDQDVLIDRLAMLALLRPGWDGEGSSAPSSQALSVVWVIIRDPRTRRLTLGMSAHADGYIALTVEGKGYRRYADLYDSYIEYEAASDDGNREWTGLLDVTELTNFLAND